MFYRQKYAKCEVTHHSSPEAVIKISAVVRTPGALLPQWEVLRREVVDEFEGHPAHIGWRVGDSTTDVVALSENTRSIDATLRLVKA